MKNQKAKKIKVHLNYYIEIQIKMNQIYILIF